jgi:hypothetical protein
MSSPIPCNQLLLVPNGGGLFLSGRGCFPQCYSAYHFWNVSREFTSVPGLVSLGHLGVALPPGILTLLPRACRWGRWNPQESPLFNLSRCSDWLPWNLRPENPICSGAVQYQVGARNPAREKSFCRWRCCCISSFQCDRFLTIERRTGHHIHAIADLEHLT